VQVGALRRESNPRPAAESATAQRAFANQLAPLAASSTGVFLVLGVEGNVPMMVAQQAGGRDPTPLAALEV
jgi:hypothetical protein